MLKHDDEHTIIETAETCKITTVLISEDFWVCKYAQLHAKYAQLHKQIRTASYTNLQNANIH